MGKSEPFYAPTPLWKISEYEYAESICAELRLDPQAMPKAYWSNTSGNDAVRHFIEKSNKTANTKREIEALVAGETVEKIIRENLT
ncbi:MAG: hypothetical protein LUF35_01905 [Lachnospiraceae bacterium]|nr:hypothetical protein [Lachnospiraceae bacterium]